MTFPLGENASRAIQVWPHQLDTLEQHMADEGEALTGKMAVLQSFSTTALATETPKKASPPMILTTHPTLSQRSLAKSSYFLKSSMTSSASSEFSPFSTDIFSSVRGKILEASAERMTSDSSLARSESEIGETRLSERT